LGGSDAVQLTVAGDYACVLLADGNVTCWGGAFNGTEGVQEFGPGDGYRGGDAVQVEAGGSYACARLSDGNVTCWGSGSGGMYENITRGYDGGDATDLGVTYGGACALTASGNVTCWGGEASLVDVQDRTPVQLGSRPVDLDAGAGKGCALLVNERVTCWSDEGSEIHHQPSSPAVQVSASDEWCELSAAGNATCPGVIGNDWQGNLTKVAVGTFHACGLTETGDVRCWGQRANEASYIMNYTGGNATDVTVSRDLTCILLQGGNVTCQERYETRLTGTEIWSR